MCGIAGWISPRPFGDAARLCAMRDALVHRGPDDAGDFLWNAEGRSAGPGESGIVGLAHRRLSILDLSSAGRQPMSNETGDVWIVFNGEFYNFGDFRPALAERHRFVSRTDTEVLLHLYEERGIEGMLRGVNGMFAFALWDVRARTLFLARDRLGKKPLYYSLRSDGTLLFASEIKALRAGGVETSLREPDRAALAQFWTYGYDTGEQTIFPEIRRLLPGHYAIWRDGHLETREYWDCPFGLEVRARPVPELAEELEALLCDAIRLRLIADVPVGLFLSGGVDSAVIAALTRKAVKAEVESYTIGFAEASHDESPHAAAVARHLGLPNRVLRVTEDLLPHAAAIARHYDTPFGDSSAIPTWFVSRLAREHVTVALTGDAGDELFAGYRIYAKALQLWGNRAQRRLFDEPRGPIRRLMDEAFRRFYRRRALTVIEWQMNPRGLRRVLAPAITRELAETHPFQARERWYPRVDTADLLSRLQYVNLKTYLPDDILEKVDRASMAWALECRSPFLDYRVVEFAARLPYEAKVDEQGRQKRILRCLLSKYVPASLWDRPKQGFSIPWSQWCRGPFGDALREKWRGLKHHGHRPEAADWLFPRGREGNPFHQWRAFVALLFFEENGNALSLAPAVGAAHHARLP